MEMENETKKDAPRNPWFYVSMIAVIVIIVLAYKVMVPSTGRVIGNENIPSVPRNAPAEEVSVSGGGDAVLGDKNAPVEIIEFSDYECPFCTRFYTNTLPQLKREYIDTGKAKLIYRDFPLDFHANAQKAAEAAECAGDEGKYYEMHDKLFEEGVSGGVSAFKQYAKDIGLDTVNFDACLDSGKHASEVQKDFQDGQKAGVSGTPSFFINGKQLVGAQPFEAFKQIIEQKS